MNGTTKPPQGKISNKDNVQGIAVVDGDGPHPGTSDRRVPISNPRPWREATIRRKPCRGIGGTKSPATADPYGALDRVIIPRAGQAVSNGDGRDSRRQGSDRRRRAARTIAVRSRAEPAETETGNQGSQRSSAREAATSVASLKAESAGRNPMETSATDPRATNPGRIRRVPLQPASSADSRRRETGPVNRTAPSSAVTGRISGPGARCAVRAVTRKHRTGSMRRGSPIKGPHDRVQGRRGATAVEESVSHQVMLLRRFMPVRSEPIACA